VSSRTPRLDAERVSYVVHELRSPLAVVSGYTSFLLDDGAGTLAPDQREILDRVRRSLKTLERLIADVAEFARTELVESRESCEEVEIDGILDEAIELTEILAGGAELSAAKADRPSGVRILGDPIAARHSLLAVAAWVARGSTHGRIEVSCRADGPCVIVAWRSNGLQAPDELDRTLRDPLAPLEGLGDAAAWRLGLAAASARLSRMGGALELTRSGDDLIATLRFRAAPPAAVSDSGPAATAR
jgi:two-component system, OmpR family, sensor histidine kinase SenX3